MIPSQLRFDIVSKDWVVIATGRGRRPGSFKKDTDTGWKEDTKKFCPFEEIDKQERPLLTLVKGEEVEPVKGKYVPDNWTAVSLPNKYPAFSPKGSLAKKKKGPYTVMDGVGYHEVLITKDHKKDIPQFSLAQTRELIELYYKRFMALRKEKGVKYISLFKNKGKTAGASLAHPHSQMIAIPVTDPDIERSLRGSKEYYHENKECVHCVMLDWDRKDKKRIVFENEHFIAVCPFASRIAFEIRIYPKRHSAYFEQINEEERDALAETFSKTLKKFHKALNDPDYNYFLHSAPFDGRDNDHYHWHWEILPRSSIWAGFEWGTGIEISTIEPEKAAAYLRKQ